MNGSFIEINTNMEYNELHDTYTVEKAVEIAGFGVYQMKLICMIGILSAADIMEIMLISVIGPILQCEWNLTSEMKAMITSIVFVGIFVGSFFWGMVADKYGRKPTFLIILCLLSYAGIITAFSKTYIWVIIFRGIVGFATGGGYVCYTLLAEFLPSSSRAKVLVLFQLWWSCGSTLEFVLAYLVLPKLGWRWLVVLSAIPIMVFAVFILFIPESPRYLIIYERKEEAQEIINDMFRQNKKPLLEGQLISNNDNMAKFSISNIFRAEYRCTFCLLLILWFGVAFCYYGLFLIDSEFLSIRSDCIKESVLQNVEVLNNVTIIDTSCCAIPNIEYYKSMIISSAGEFLVIPLNLILSDLIGRRKTLGLFYLCTSVLFLCLYICMSKLSTTMILFAIRGFASGVFNLAYLYTTEVFPTVVRSSATGLCSSFARIAAMLTPFVAQVYMPQSLIGGLIIYSFMSFLCFISALCLPIETKGREMPQTFEEVEMDLKDK